MLESRLFSRAMMEKYFPNMPYLEPRPASRLAVQPGTAPPAPPRQGRRRPLGVEGLHTLIDAAAARARNAFLVPAWAAA